LLDRFSVYVPNLLPKDENFLSGRRSCKGCGKAIAARLASKAIGNQGIRAVTMPKNRPGSASSLTSQSHMYHDVTSAEMIEKLLSVFDEIDGPFAVATQKHGKALKKAVIEIDRRIFISDPLTLTRNLQKDREALYLCFDNEPYLDLLIRQTAPQPFVLAERTHPVTAEQVRELIQKKNIPEVVLEQDFSYVATACPSFPFDFLQKVQNGLECSGNAFIAVLTPCPTGWIFPSELTIKVGHMAVQTGYYPLYEQRKGITSLTKHFKKRKPVQQYLLMQKRFLTFPAALYSAVQSTVDEIYGSLLTKERG
jgi:pyruvate ferredoxin oxidoreductase beta subunit